MPSDRGPLAEWIAETLRVAKIRLEELRLARDEPESVVNEPIKIDVTPPLSQRALDEADAWASLIADDPLKLADEIRRMFDEQPVLATITSALGYATVILNRHIDPDSEEAQLSINLLGLALQAAECFYIRDWERIAPVLLDLAAVHSMLYECQPEMDIDFADVLRRFPQLRPFLMTASRAMKAQSRATEASARQQKLEKQAWTHAYVNVIRANPNSKSKAWAWAAAEQLFGNSLTQLHVERVGRWYRRHRKDIEAALVADSPPECPSSRRDP